MIKTKWTIEKLGEMYSDQYRKLVDVRVPVLGEKYSALLYTGLWSNKMNAVMDFDSTYTHADVERETLWIHALLEGEWDRIESK